MATTMGIIALITALGAIWFTSEILRRVRPSKGPSMDRHVQELSAIISQNDRALRTLNQRLKEVEAGVQGLKSGTSSPISPASDYYREVAQMDRVRKNASDDDDSRRFRPSLGAENKRSAA